MRISDWSSDVCSSDLLRTPLNAIIGFAQTIDREIWGPVGSPRYREYAQAIADSGQHLYVLIQNILDLSRHDAGVLELDERAVDPGREIVACRDMQIGSASCRERVCQYV